MSENSDKCAICLNNYTLTELHRPMSLECGHLFGGSCIKKWFNKQKTALCPTCANKSRFRNLRPIYATEIIVNENDILMEKIISLQEDKKELEMENMKLKNTIDLLQNEVNQRKYEPICIKDTDFSTYKLIKKIPYNHKEHHVFFEYEPSDNIILLTFHNNETFGIKKFDVSDFSNQEIVFKITYNELFLTRRQNYTIQNKMNIKINDLKVSPFKDSTALFCYEKNLILIHTTNNTIVFSLILQENIMSVSYDHKDRNYVYAADTKGYFYKISLFGQVNREKVANLPIHSIFHTNSNIFCSTVNGIYIIGENIEKFDLVTVMNITGDTNNILISVRQKDHTIMHVYIDQNVPDELNKFFFSFKETKRLRDRFYNNNILIINNEKMAIMVYDVFGNMSRIFWAGDRILSFCIGTNFIFIFTIKGFVIYGC